VPFNIDHGKTLKRAVVTLSADGDVVAAVALKRIKVYLFETFNDHTTGQFRLQDGNGGTDLTFDYDADQIVHVVVGPVMPPAFLFQTSVGNSLFCQNTGGGDQRIAVSYWEDD